VKQIRKTEVGDYDAVQEAMDAVEAGKPLMIITDPKIIALVDSLLDLVVTYSKQASS
jgi:hypothetical protein